MNPIQTMNPIQAQAILELQGKMFTITERKKIYRMKSDARRVLLDTNIDKVLDNPSIPLSDVIIAGGCFCSLFHGEEPRDIDVFILNGGYGKTVFINNEVWVKDVKRGSYFDNPEVIESFMIVDGGNLNYIFTKYKTREELITDFDYAHCCVSYDLDKDLLYISRETFDAIRDRKIIINNPNNLKENRRQKFLYRGFIEVTS